MQQSSQVCARPVLKRRSMRSGCRREQAGFTLMELMAVVVIIGVLSAVAVPSLRRFITKSRESEAPTNLAALARGARGYYNDEHMNLKTGVVSPPQFPPSSTSTNLNSGYATMPNITPCKEIVGSPRYLANPARWHANHTTEPWTNLKFAIATSHFFQYQYKASNSGKDAVYTVRAIADMDCDTSKSTFFFRGSIDLATGEIVTNSLIVSNQGE